MMQRSAQKIVTLLIFAVAPALAGSPSDGITRSEGTTATLNGLTFTFDANTGSLLRLAYEPVGVMLECVPERATILDLAYPLEEFAALRLASRFSTVAAIDVSDNQVRLRWDQLGSSRSYLPINGHVAAEVMIKADDDGRSVILSCTIDNQTDKPIQHIMFPDLGGLKPIGSEDQTFLRSAGGVANPFHTLRPNEYGAPFYAFNTAITGQEQAPGSLYSPMWLRWIDYGGLNGGFCLFPKRWGWEPFARVRTQRSMKTGKLRLSHIHDVSQGVTIEPKTTWSSGEFVLTPHAHGWAEGIEPFRQWVHQHVQREYVIPKHVREGLGFRSVFMLKGGRPHTKEDIAWSIDDLIDVAAEAAEHGIDELVPWFWCDGFQLPMTTKPILGTNADFVAAIKACKKLGVHVSPFVSIYHLANPTAKKYGVNPTTAAGWTYHIEMIPMFNPPFASAQASAWVDQRNMDWQRDVLANWKELVDMGITSVVWDVYHGIEEEPNVYTLTSQMRKIARASDPESVFAAESVLSIEIEANYIDYTWNWLDYRDARPFLSVMPAPRLNYNLDRSPRVAKVYFMDNIYINVMPSLPDDINGSAPISHYPEVSAALKQCSKLRRQFLKYFVNGTMIGDCVLNTPLAGAMINAYTLDDRMLVIGLNFDAPKAVTLQGELAPWLQSADDKYTVRVYDTNGEKIGEHTTGSEWREESAMLKPLDFVFYEIIAR